MGSGGKTEENHEASALLNLARSMAILAFRGQTATPEMLASFAAFVRDTVLDQADEGRWSSFAIHDRRKLLGLVVSAKVVTSLVGGARIEIDYDFGKTSVPMLLTSSKPPGSRAKA